MFLLFMPNSPVGYCNDCSDDECINATARVVPLVNNALLYPAVVMKIHLHKSGHTIWPIKLACSDNIH